MLAAKVKTSIGIIVLLAAAILIIIGYFLRIDRYALLGNVEVDWQDCIKINNEKYYSEFVRNPLDSSFVGQKIGVVKFTVSEKVHSSYYFFRNGDATFLTTGTEIFSVKADTKAIAAKIGSQYFLYRCSEK